MTITPKQVFDWLKVDRPSVLKSDQMQVVVDAVEAHAAKVVEALDLVDPRDKDLDFALIMQAARLSKRSSSPEGITGVAEFGVVRISRFDPDISEMLGPFLKIMAGASGTGAPPPIEP